MSYWRGRRVLVTGGAGFIGANLVRRLTKMGAAVRIADSLARTGAGNILGDPGLADVDFVRADLRDPAACAAACAGMDVVFHLASNVGNLDHYRDRPGDVLIQNTLIDANVIEASRRAGVKRYFYASSTHVYPAGLQRRADAPPLREEDALPADPPVTYGWAKLIGEQAVAGVAAQGELRAAVLRMMNPYGPYQDIDPERASVIPAFIRRAIEYPGGGPLALRTTGDETRAFCYIDDTLDAMLLSAEKLDDRPLVGPLNVGGEEPVSILDLAREVVAVSGKSVPITTTADEPLIRGQTIDCSRARAELDGWRPRLTLREGLARTYAFIDAQLRALAGAEAALKR